MLFRLGGRGTLGPALIWGAGAISWVSTSTGRDRELEIPAENSPNGSRATAIRPTLIRKKLPVAEAPTAVQVKALGQLQQDATRFAAAAADYRDTLTLVVRHHYAEQRRRILEVLDKQVDQEEEQVLRARSAAIGALEQFVSRYSGPNARPEATPDAMFRLAALYEERARASDEADLSKALQPAMALYLKVIEGFPDYRDLAAVSYYLGHAYTDSGRLREGQQAWRSLVCQNRYPLRPAGSADAGVHSTALSQDHSDPFWNKWYNRNPVPLDQLGAESLPSPGQGTTEARREELSYLDPYEDCEAVAQDVAAGAEPRYVAETWWQLGNYHFDQLDAAGPYGLNRALSAYSQSMKYKKPPLYGVAMYKRAWAYFKQQRYRTAVKWFVNLLHYADLREAETGDPGADFRSEAYTYIAGSLTYVDFLGPPETDPFIPRNDVLDTELDPVRAEEKMAIAIRRAQDPLLIPQNKKWTAEIYKALGQEFIDITQNRNAIAVYELTLGRFPMDRDAPVLRNKVAGLYDQLSRLAPDGSIVRREYADKALRARTELARYVGATQWTEANSEDAEALAEAERLAKRGLQRAAADNTNQARALVARAQQASDEAEQRDALVGAINGYRMARKAWNAYIALNPAALDSYESRFWLADASYWGVILEIALGQSPSISDINSARVAAIDVRDSTEDNRYLQPAAFYLVSMSDKLLQEAYREYDASGGTRGVEPRESVRFVKTGTDRSPQRAQIPGRVARAIEDRDVYNAAISFEDDPQKNGMSYAFQAADYLFVYGHFDEARRRFEPMMEEHCARDEWGYKAWEKLISMSNFEGDAERSRILVESRSCAFDEETLAAEEALRTPVRQGVAYLDARKIYDEAEKLDPGPDRDKKWRMAAAAYKVALDAAPDRDEAPEAAMNGAFAYKQVGEYDKAISMYELFIARYGNRKKLRAIRDGDPSSEPPLLADPAKFGERVKFLKLAYDALASSYVLFFDYPKAAGTFEKISGMEHFSSNDRRDAARQSLALAASLANASAMRGARKRFADLGASPEELAEADFVIATAALKQWDPLSPDRGANRQARRKAEQQMTRYFEVNERNGAAAKFMVGAAYWVARTKRAARDARANRWWTHTKSAFERYSRQAAKKADGTSIALGTAQATFAAEAAYVQIDAELRKSFDYETGHHRFAGTTVEVLAQYRKGASEAKERYDALQEVIDRYASPEWATAALARQGSLYDSLRTGLYNTKAPELKVLDRRTEALIRRAENSDSLELQEKADAIRMRVEAAWRQARDRELDGADQVMVDRYGNAISLAHRYNVSNPTIVRATQRLAFFTDVVGEAKLSQYMGRVKNLKYSPGLFLRLRPGLVGSPRNDGLPPPAPAAAVQQ